MRILKSILFTLALILGAQYASAQCNPIDPSKVKEVLEDFDYGASDVSKIENNTSEKTKEIGIAVFSGIKYKFVFPNGGLPKGTVVRVYNKKITKTNRKELWNSKNSEVDENGNYIYVFENNSRRIYIDYIIPGNAGEGCSAVIVGQKFIPGFNMF